MNPLTFEKRLKIREAYKKWKPRADPYRFGDWMQWFTAIESNVWADIRYLGLPFYPQYPVGNFFIDFADPVKKIGIEVDGKKFHSEKYQSQDKRRQKLLEKHGWTIIRIQGSATYTSREDYERDDILHDEFFTECSEGILLKLKTSRYAQEK